MIGSLCLPARELDVYALPRSCTWSTFSEISQIPGLCGCFILVLLSFEVIGTSSSRSAGNFTDLGARGNHHGPPFIREISSRLSKRLTAWQTLVITLLWLYISRNFAKICGLESPEPLANLYTRAYFRATWVTTALDAGFWTAVCYGPGPT